MTFTPRLFFSFSSWNSRWNAPRRISTAAPLLALATSWFSTPLARADFALHFWENQHRPEGERTFTPEIAYLGTSRNFNASGVASAIAGLTSYSRLQTDLMGAAGINSRFTLFGRMSWANISIDRIDTGGRTFGLTDQTLGTVFRVLENKNSRNEGLSIDAQFQADIPAYSNVTAAAEGIPFRGDGSLDLTGGLFLNFRFAQTAESFWEAAAGGGYTFRSDGFSAAVPWSATLRYRSTHNGFNFSLSGLGVQSLQSDTSSVTRSNLESGGSFLVNAVNASNFTTRAELGYQFSSRVGASVKAFQTFAGVNAPEVKAVLLSLQYQFAAPLASRQEIDPFRQSGPEYGRSNQGVVDYIMDAKVLRMNDRLNLVRINKGKADGVQVGQVFDIFSVKKDGSLVEAVARAKCQSVGPSEAVLNITEYYKEVWIEEGFIAKRPLQ